jgi:hypothetical protein
MFETNPTVVSNETSSLAIRNIQAAAAAKANIR